jgi:hypothetical protein
MKGVYHARKVNAMQIGFGDGFVDKGHGDSPGKGDWRIVPRAGAPWTPTNRIIKTAGSAVLKRYQSIFKRLEQIT